MTYERKIAKLLETQMLLEQQLVAAMKEDTPDLTITEIKKKKLLVKDLIRQLTVVDSQGREFN